MTTTQSFFSKTPSRQEQDTLLNEYSAHLELRNGAEFVDREERMTNVFDETDVRASFSIDEAKFNRNYAAFTEKDISEEELALLAFVKINAGEAYGVEVTSTARAHLWERDEPKYAVEKIIADEETFHTRLLLGATNHFDGLNVEGAWKPAWPLRLLIGGLARFPAWMFHPVLLGSEVSGVYSFNWLLNRVQTLFPNDPQVRASMEERLLDILIDEVGHIAYNRILIGDRGLGPARSIAGHVTNSQRIMTPEMLALGFNEQTMREVASFDYEDLPQSVRDASFFV